MSGFPQPRSLDELTGLIRKNFPEVTWQNAWYIGEGWDHEVVILDEALVFRFPSDDEYRQLLKAEIDILKRLTPLLPVRIPAYTYLAPDHSCAGYPIVPGIKLTTDAYHELPVVEQSILQDQLAGFLSRLHAIDPATDSAFADVPSSYLREDQQEVRKGAERDLPTILTADEMETVNEIVAEVDTLLARALPQVFIHNDVYDSHLFWDTAAGQLGVIDFSDMTRGDPAIDFAELYDYGQDFIGVVYDRYEGRKDDGFLARARTYHRWQAVYMMTDYFRYRKISFAEARQAFDRVRADTH